MFTSTVTTFGRVFVCALCFAPLLVSASRFAQEASDLKPEQAAKFGLLENGLRYVILPFGEPVGRASLGLLLGAGSRHEDDSQRGAAHFLEHAEFNGFSNNSSVGYDHTQYRLELPDTGAASLVEGLRLLAGVLSGQLLSADQDVVTSSKQESRIRAEHREQQHPVRFILGPGDLPPRGEQTPREKVEEFWDAWYHPGNAVVVVVGVVDVEAVEQQIFETFAPLEVHTLARPEPEFGAIPNFEGVRFGHHFESEARGARILLMCVTPCQPVLDTVAHRVSKLPRQLALAMLNRRYAELARREAPPFGRSTAVVSESLRFLSEASVEIVCQPEEWPAALAAGEQELRRALEHGFELEELQAAVAAVVLGLEQAVETASIRSVGSLADMAMANIAAGEVLAAPADLLAVLQPALQAVTLDDCAKALSRAFAGNGLHVLITGNAPIPGDALAAIEAAYEESRVLAVLSRADEQARAWSYTDFGPPGEVTKREYIPDLDITRLTYANGVRLNLKQTDFEPGRIMVSARVGTGSISEPPDQRGLAQIAGGVFSGGGLGRHSRDDLRRILAGRNAGFALQVTTDALVLGYPPLSNTRGTNTRGTSAGGTTREDVLLTLQLLTAYLADPGYRPEGFRQNQQTLGLIYGSIERVLTGPLLKEVANLIAGGDSRFGLPPREAVMARTLDEVRAWLSPQLAHGAIEVAMVGDLDVEATIDAVAKTLGALPPREPRPALEELRRVSFPSSPFTRSYAVQSQIPQGLVLLYWPTSDGFEARFAQRLSLLARVYGDRLRAKLREETGGPYGSRVESLASETYPGYGYLFTSIDVDPPAADKLAEVAIAIADDLTTTGVSEEELHRVRLSMLSVAGQSLRDNAHWLGNVLAKAQEKPAVLDWERIRITDLEGITVEEINTLAQHYLGRDRVSRVTVLPAE